MYHKLQYISQGNTGTEHLLHIRRALSAGCRWIQLRMKDSAEQEIVDTAREVRHLCREYEAVFIMNDNAVIAGVCGADGVHLGLTDMPVADARKILGDGKIIGGSANTLTDVLQRIEENCTYIGLGPYRLTATKKNLSPVLGPRGYRHLLQELRSQPTDIPVYAIGGIVPEDVPELLSAGIHGVAVSGVISGSTDQTSVVKQFNELLYANT
jgi:thiamine-phosphate pyrophosphorylase